MIAEVLKRKISRPFKGLVDYLNGKPGRVETSFFLNASFDDFDLNLKEIKAFQTVARSGADKTYHFVLSLREGEKLNNDEIRRAVKMQLKALGYENHQALVTAHNDTANFHIHVGVNKVCPETQKTITPYKDFEKLDKTCEKLEKIFGLQPDNRIGQGTHKTKRLYDGRQSFQEWVSALSPEIVNRVETVKTWSELHSELAKFNLGIRPRGAGFVIADLNNKLFMKASSVDRMLSKKSLESLFGKYETPGLTALPKPVLKYEGIPKGVKKQDPLFKEFKTKETLKKQDRDKGLGMLYDKHNQKIISLKDWYSSCKKELEGNFFIQKRERYKILSHHRETMKQALERYHSELQDQKNKIIRQTKTTGWNDFVLEEAKKGRAEVLNLLRSTPKKTSPIKDNFISLENSRIILPGFHKVSRYGEFIYTFGKVQVRDTGKRVSFFGDLSDKEGLAKALNFVSDKNGKDLFVNGTRDFKGKVSEVIDRNKIDLKPKNLQRGRGHDQGR